MLEITDLSVATGRPAVMLMRDLSRTIEAGQYITLTGPSGAGKTTLLRTIAGLIDPPAGQIRLDGATGETIGWPRFRRQVMLVAQHPVLLDATVEQNLAMPFAYRSVERRFDRAEAEQVLARLGLGEPMERDARSLSQGQQQRVCLARAMLLRPRVLLLDEPAAALDEQAANQLDAVLRRYVHAHDAAVLAARHDVDRAMHNADERLDLTAYLAAPALEPQR